MGLLFLLETQALPSAVQSLFGFFIDEFTYLGGKVRILAESMDERPNAKECFDNLGSLERYAVTQLGICDFGKKESVVVEEFISSSSGRVSVLARVTFKIHLF